MVSDNQTRDFRETILALAQREPEFRRGLLTEALDCFLNGEIAEGKLLLRDYLTASRRGAGQQGEPFNDG